ncbi:MAG: glycosyltransferase family 2 protein [bacterium]
MKVSVIIVSYNSARFLPGCLASVFNQIFSDYEIIVIDNNSIDRPLEFIKENYPKIKILKNINNLGLCRANNQGIKMAQGEYVLIMNPDVILEPGYLEKIIGQAEKLPQGGSFGGKLLRLINGRKTGIIDSTGLKILSHYKIIDRGAGERDKGQFNKTEEVFGQTGACVLYRKKAIEEVGLFDEKFFVYKEDIDMAWRLRKANWQNWYMPEAVAYHQRYAGVGRERRKRNRLVNYYSYRNHLLLLSKYLDKKTFWQNAWRIIPYEIGKFIYILFFETRNIKAFFDFLKLKK